MRIFAHVATWGCLLGLVGGCGGSDFTTGSVDASGVDGMTDPGTPQEGGGFAEASSQNDGLVTQDGGALEGGSDANPAEAGSSSGVKCGPNVCAGITPVCCAAGSQCAHVECGCGTQLECARDLDCPASQPVCCINTLQDLTCAGGHFVAACATGCRSGGMQMCDPGGSQQQCLNGQCSTDSGDLSNAGLPPNLGFGVCK